MDVKTCIQKLRYVCSASMGTVDSDGKPQVRIINIMHVEPEKGEIYFVTARGKAFYGELLQTQQVAITVLTRFNEMIRVRGIPDRIEAAQQRNWLDRIFKENPVMNNVYPGESRYILEVFVVKRAEVEYFNLGVHPIFRESYSIGKTLIKEKGYEIADGCIGCGTCKSACPQQCIREGSPYEIAREHCLHCGLCQECCPAGAVRKLTETHIS